MAAVDDFDGNGTADIWWRHNTRGENFIWLEYAGAIVLQGGHTVEVSDTSYSIAATGDFNGDRKADVLWRNDTTGHSYIWLMDGRTANGAILPDLPSTDWRVAAVGDYDGDEKSDIFWRNVVTGQTAVWLMNGFNVASRSGLPTVSDLNWVIRNP